MQWTTLVVLASAFSLRPVGSAARHFRTSASSYLQLSEHHVGELLCRVQPGAGSGGRPLEVWLLPGNARAVAFGDDRTLEALVHCTGPQPECRGKPSDTRALFGAAAQGADGLVPDDVVSSIDECPECPCNVDPEEDMLESQHDIVDAVQRKCTAARIDKPVDILMIGLGGGMVHSRVKSSCPEGTRVRSVEIDARFVAAVGRYFGLPLRRGISEVVVGDAFDVVEKEAHMLEKMHTHSANTDTTDDDEPPKLGAEGYDIIVVDCFIGGGETPEHCRSAQFIEDLESILKPGGEVIHHLWHDSLQKTVVASQYKSTRKAYDETFGAGHVESRPIFRQDRSLMVDDLVFATKGK